MPFTLKWSSAAAWNGEVTRLPFLSHRHRRSSNWPRSATPIVDDVNVVSVLGYQPHVCESLIRVCPGASHLTEKQSHVCQYLRGKEGRDYCETVYKAATGLRAHQFHTSNLPLIHRSP